MRKLPAHRPWRTSREIAGVRANAVAALRTSRDGATAEVDQKTLRNLIEVCEQAMQTERGHEPLEVRAPDPNAGIPFMTTEDRKALRARNFAAAKAERGRAAAKARAEHGA